MNKKLLLSLGLVTLVLAAAIGGTVAFFSDTETSTGNTFKAGAIDLKIDSACTYNGATSGQCGSWQLKDLNAPLAEDTAAALTSDKFFNFIDVKPGDYGENTISLHVYNNDAWVCAQVSNLVSADNDITEPEGGVDLDLDSGELEDAMLWTIWRDDGDNIKEGGEPILVSGHPVNGILPLYDSTTGTGLAAGDTGYIGVAWELPEETGNEAQTDSLTGDVSFYAVQKRHNETFQCSSLQKVFVYNEKSAGASDNGQGQPTNSGFDQPYVTWEIEGDKIKYTFHNPTTWLYVFDVRIDGELGVPRMDGAADLTNTTIGAGPLAAQIWGPTYHRVVVDGRPGTNVHEVTQTFTGVSKIEVGLREGAERDYYIGWLEFTAN